MFLRNPDYSLYHGTPIKSLTGFTLTPDKRNSRFEAASLGVWFTDDFRVACSFAFKTIREYLPRLDPNTNDYERWSNGEVKQYAHYELVGGTVYMCNVILHNPAIYESDSDPDGPDSLELMMNDRDQFAAYIDRRRGTVPAGYWKRRMIALESEETNRLFRDYLTAKGYDGIILRNTQWDAIDKQRHTQVCVFNPDQIVIVGEQEPDPQYGEINY